MAHYHVKAGSRAKASSIFALLMDGPTWPSWMAVDEVGILDVGRDGIGQTRRVVAGRHVGIERIVELETDRRLVYSNDSPPFERYRGEILLTPHGGGTLIDWRGSFAMRSSILAVPMTLYLRRFIGRAARGLARRAELVEGDR